MCQPGYINFIDNGYEIGYLFPIQFENAYTGLGAIRDSQYLNNPCNFYVRTVSVQRIAFEVGLNVEYRAAFIAIGSYKH